MKLRWNPFIGNFDYVGTTGGTVPANVATVTHVANYAALPDPTTVELTDIYICDASQGTSWLPGSLGGTYYNKGVYTSNLTSWIYSATPYQATQSEVNTGTATDTFVTPSTLTNATVITNKATISYVDGKVANAINDGTTTIAPSQNAVFDALVAKVTANVGITGATKTKITYDAKGLVTGGVDATTADIAETTDKHYQSDLQDTYNDATSSIQTQLNNKLSGNVSTKTANYTITSANDIILANATSGVITITLPTAVGVTEPYKIKRINTNSNVVTVNTTSSQTMDGSTTLNLVAYQSLEFVSDGANWFIV